jgi:serine/threonine protein kinase
VLHRDLKPANVLLESDTGRVVLTDFGLAQLPGVSTLTESGAFVGSPEYTAPERISGERSGPEADLWSLGALLCAVLSGVSPFHRDSLGGVLHAVVLDEIRLPERAGGLTPLLRGLLERDPVLRLDATEAGRMLREFLDTGRITAPRADGVRRWLRADTVPEDSRSGVRWPRAWALGGPALGAAAPRRALHIALGILALVVAMATVGIWAVALRMRADGGFDRPPPAVSTGPAHTDPAPTDSAW